MVTDWLPGMPEGYARAIAPQPVDEDGVVIGSQLAAIVYRKTLPMLQDGEMTDRYTAAVVLKASPLPIYLLVSTYMPGDAGVEHHTRRLARKHNWGRLRHRMIWACDRMRTLRCGTAFRKTGRVGRWRFLLYSRAWR